MTYAATPEATAVVAHHSRYSFEHADISDRDAVARVLTKYQPDVVIHLAAETHVDRSIDGPLKFVATNVSGTAVLLDACLVYWRSLDVARRDRFRFIHVSTDEVFGSLEDTGRFIETSPYDPSSPYAASKAAADHLARAWRRTYGLPVIVTNCSNNYGPFQFPEKLIPLVIIKACRDQAIPVYGTGNNVRDWLFVEDHAEALGRVIEAGEPGETYLIGAESERTNIAVVEAICAALDRVRPAGAPHRRLITFVDDRPGHDRRYALDTQKARKVLGWRSRVTFDDGINTTVRWYLENRAWWETILKGRYSGHRLGLATDSVR